MPNSILVAYATRFGSTEEVADFIAARLRECGLEVGLHPMQEVQTIEGYGAAVLGSAVNHGNWLPAAIDFVKENQDTLSKIPVALFTVHITNLGADEQSRLNRQAYLDEVRLLLQPVDEVFFAGKFHRKAAKELIPGWIAWLVPTLDLRKWDQIHAWARTLPTHLLLQTEPQTPP